MLSYCVTLTIGQFLIVFFFIILSFFRRNNWNIFCYNDFKNDFKSLFFKSKKKNNSLIPVPRKISFQKNKIEHKNKKTIPNRRRLSTFCFTEREKLR